MPKLFQFNPSDNRPVNYSGEVFYPGTIYRQDELCQFGDILAEFKCIGEGPPDCGDIDAKDKLAENAEEFRAWINSLVARVILGWASVGGGSNGRMDITAKTLARSELHKLVTAAAKLGMVVDEPDYDRLNEMRALSVLNRILQWATVRSDGDDAAGRPRTS